MARVGGQYTIPSTTTAPSSRRRLSRSTRWRAKKKAEHENVNIFKIAFKFNLFFAKRNSRLRKDENPGQQRAEHFQSLLGVDLGIPDREGLYCVKQAD